MGSLSPEKVVFDSANGNGARIVGFYFPSSAEHIKGVVQICHGMAEYITRYEELIKHLNDAGFHVCGMDMLGHGQTYEINKSIDYPKGYFGQGIGAFRDILRDEMELHRLSVVRFEGVSYFCLYGHSMGSFVVRSIYSTPEYSCEFKRFVFASTMGPNPLVGVGRFLAGTATLFGGGKKKGRFFKKLAFGSYLKRIENPQSGAEWISTDPAEVQKFIDDPMLGFTFTQQGFKTLFDLVAFIQSSKAYSNLADRPCLFTYGTEDPVGSYGVGVEKVITRMKHMGADVTYKNYGPYRHEIQHEPVRGEYFRDIIEFLSRG